MKNTIERHADVFISYRNDGEGQNVAALLTGDLKEAGYTVYFNAVEQGSNSFPQRLRDAIEGCSDVIAIVSKEYLGRLQKDEKDKNNWIREELSTAKAAGCNIIPVLVNGTEMADRSQIDEDMQWFLLLDAIVLPYQYKDNPFEKLQQRIDAKPDGADTYKFIDNSNVHFRAESRLNASLSRTQDGERAALLESAVLKYYSIDGNLDYNGVEQLLSKIEDDDDYDVISAARDNLLAHMYYSGQIPRKEQSYARSAQLHAQAAKFIRSSKAETCFAEAMSLGTDVDFESAKSNYESYVNDTDDVIAQLEFALYLERFGEFSMAAKYYDKIRGASSEAAYRLAMLYKRGVLNKKHRPDYAMAMLLLTPIACKDNPHRGAAYELGLCYARPIGKEAKPDFYKAEQYLRIAADRGHGEASYMLGWILENRLADTSASLEEAVHYYEIAAASGQVSAQTRLSILYQLKETDFCNYHKAYWYAVSAVKSGSAEAYLILGNLLLLGRGCLPDPDAAYKYFKRAETAGIYSGKVMSDLMERTVEEKDVSESDMASAFTLFDSKNERDWKAAAKLAEKWQESNEKAANLLGLAYHIGRGVTRDDKKAVQYFTQAATMGYRSAYFNLADAYFFGTGVNIDYAEAAKWYLKGADTLKDNEGDHDCEAHIGHMYRIGLGVDKDLKKARTYLYRASNNYTPAATYELALICEEEGDMDGAKEWYTRAAERHVAAAAERMAQLTEADDSQKWRDLALKL